MPGLNLRSGQIDRGLFMMEEFERKKGRVRTKNPASLFLYSYFSIILIGALLLSFPISSSSGMWTSFIDSFFTAASALCVTGLSIHVTATYWSIFGKAVILLLIQLGGLGIVTAAGSIALVFNRKFSIQESLYIAEERNTSGLRDVAKFMFFVFKLTLIFEFLGALLLSFDFVPRFGFIKGSFFSVFHSISAFCNAGFDLISHDSMASFILNPLVNIVLMVLIVFGGLGFVVYQDILVAKKWRKLGVHTKLVLTSTLFFIILPGLLFLVLEWGNPNTLGPLSIGGKMLAAGFQSVTTRTAGFCTINQSYLMPSSFLLTLFLMFIGGAPAGTAGGFKLTTFLILILSFRKTVKKEQHISAFKRTVPRSTVEKALAILVISLIWVGSVIFILTITDCYLGLSDIVFEVISAYGTVGLSRGITTLLSPLAKILVAMTMIFGKIGPLAMVYSFTAKTKSKAYKEAETAILVG